ncbi:PAS domain-containing protein [Hymenobacter busanensis]|uniref:histidine kinase n=1 Tax=Hymenobacter busanensis TaxID=2607656 RepID=A0A7L4ZX20_9BACT|nr:ATP-binding protein [Hymenobacter busanensis]KAA9332094.1 PAS domain-containing protein [Hymenobacter busanensis]QHJ07567.1 PAS domain-containing protein [Hymenobacter busanensis]
MSQAAADSADELARENDELRLRLQEAEELIHAIRTGAVDALAVQGPEGPRIFTLEGADQGYRTLIEQMNEGALLLGPDGTLLYCNAALAGLLGVALQDIIGGNFQDFVPKGFRRYWATLMGNGWKGKSKGEMPLRTKAGTLLPFSLSMNVLAFHETPVLAVIVTNLSAQREIRHIQALVDEQNVLITRKNEELRAQESARQMMEQAAAEATRVLEGIPQIAWTASPSGRLTYLNRRWFDYTGSTSEVPLHEQWQEHLHPDDRAAVSLRWKKCRRSGQAFDIEYRFRNHAGDYRWMLGRGLPSRNEQGEIVQWVGTNTDIHEHKLALARIDQAQRQLQDNNQQLTRANVDLDNFIYTASHDLKAPISNIEGLLQALLVELPPAGRSGEVQPIIDMMQGSVERFKRTIEHLTEVTKLQKENDQPASIIELKTVVEEVLLDLEPLIAETEARLDVNVATCPALSFAEKNMRSVVYNLLSNALKYRHPERVPHVQLRCHEADEYLVLEVQDNGLGLDVQHEHKLFAMFQRFHAHVEGSGIGLYMVKKIVENAGGRIEVQSVLGEGTTFSVFFRR